MSRYADFSWVSATQLAEHAQDDGLWDAYRQTKVVFDGHGTVEPLGSGTVPPLGSLHVVTAIQPGKTDPRSAESLARLGVLDTELQTRGLDFIRAVGMSLDEKYSEESRAVRGLSDDEARELGMRFGQVAVFGWKDTQWSLLACATDKSCSRSWRWIPSSS